MDKSAKNIFKAIEALLGKRPVSASDMLPEEPYDQYLAASSPSLQELENQAADSCAGLPSFAITFAGNGGGQMVSRTVGSLSAQTYTRWKLVSDPIEERFDYIMYMWPGDTLPPHALYEFAHAANGRDLLFCDEDIDGEAGRCCPQFKPELNRFTQLSYDMLGSGVVVSRALFMAAGPMTGDTGTHRYAYNLRCAQRCSSPGHIPKVLYTCCDLRQAGPDARLSVEQAAGDGQVALPGSWGGSFIVEAKPKRQSVSIIIRSRDRHEPLMALLNSIDLRRRGDNVSIVIADQGSADRRMLEYYNILERNRAAKVYYGGSVSYPALLNMAAKEADTDLMIFIDSNVEVLSVNWIDSLVSQAVRPGAGAAGPKMIGPDGRLLHTGAVVGIGGWLGSPYAGTDDDCRTLRKRQLTGAVRGVSALSIACMALDSDVFFSAGCFDESFESAGFDAEFCLRMASRGHSCIYVPHAAVRYNGPLPGISAASQGDRQRCYDAIRSMLIEGDPNYSRNFNYSSPIPRVSPAPKPAALLNGIYAGK